ncbi:MAG: nitrogen regulation protein NR(I) [Pseudomonadota bacterium]
MMVSKTINAWLVDDDQSVRWVLEQALKQAGMEVRSFDNGDACLAAMTLAQPDVLITDIRMPGIDGLELMQAVHQHYPSLPVIVITAHSDLDSAVSAYQGGAFEYLPKPFDIDDAVSLVQRAYAESQEKGQTDADLPTRQPLPELIGQAPAMQEVFRSIGRLSRSSMTVLVTGESGTGKELIARALHRNSPRAKAPFIALNTSAIAAELLESELFGHEKGAFTGADARRVGRFEQSDNGTLFLDEIGDMSAALQTRLLRVLAEGEFYRVGGQVPIKVDVRVIAATHQDLATAVKEGRFREDLFHRLNVIRIVSPPLRERRDDVPSLIQHYLLRAAKELGVEAKTLSDEAASMLYGFDWPGNVRQLVNACRRLTVTAPGSVIGVDDIPDEFGGYHGDTATTQTWTMPLSAWASGYLNAQTTPPLLSEALPAFERTVILAALQRASGQRGEAARLLGWGRNTLTRKIAQLKLDV